MKVTYMAYVRFRQANTSYDESRRIIPGDEVDLADSHASFFQAEEIVQLEPQVASAPASAPIADASRYEEIVKSQIIASDIQPKDSEEDDFVLDLPDVREKVKQKFDEMKKASETPAPIEEEPKKKSRKGLKKCRQCGRFNCSCEKA